MFEKALEEPTDARFVIGAFDGDALIGICGFVPLVWDAFRDFANTGTLIQMYVRAAYRGKKIGLGLAQAVLQEAFQIPGIDRILLTVVPDNSNAIRVYEQASFKVASPAKELSPENAEKVMVARRLENKG